MPRVARCFPAAVSLILLGLPLYAQITDGIVAQPNHIPPAPRIQPYTAEFKLTQVRTLADGTTITHEGTEIRARDSAGITMQSNSNQSWEMGRMLGTSGGVHDTDGTILANWYSVTNIGRVFKMPPKEQRHGCWISANLRMDWKEHTGPPPPTYVFNEATRTVEQIPAPVQRSRPKFDELGSVSIQGVEAQGRRTTRTISVGEVGNDRTIVTVEESWFARSLGLNLRDAIDDPSTGRRTRELVSLTLGEPDPALFQPPPDYEVTTEELHQVTCSEAP